ncbi:hypothetical protein Sipo8835_23965 [Streptomyces ipomoeae]|uniref:DDE Tnp4 domain-containing protein n=1 Tax=Streptomyces ipomoeae TaxID=103232 RepID=A0AAE9AYQ6_9ACTN|nr:transposase family protein [Streptomyces ipomoeae]TQE30046.1 hypothetical protein Sipo8835_23965 [Streptomyces ipomoeae]
MLAYPSAIDLSSSHLRLLTRQLAERRRRVGTRWRRPPPNRQAPLVLLQQTLKRAAAKAFVILDGTLLPIDRIVADRPFYSGKHRKHGMNVQVLTDPFGRLLWTSAALPGAVHDIKAARTIGEQAMATLKSWRLLRKLRCSTTRITGLVQAVLALHIAWA